MDAADTVLSGLCGGRGRQDLLCGTQRPDGPFDREIDGGNNVLMPGFVNAHTHVPMTAMRGYGDGNNLQDWLEKYIFPHRGQMG